ncbi:MAG: ABC transporter substrate-binding protein [Candidatus Contendobacter sp.]|nr:ABC transporter substrate-binding protein [Candidatus Contendobacter sp.]
MTLPLPIISPNRQTLPALRRIAFGLLCVLILAGAARAGEPAAPPTASRTGDCLERYDPAIDYFPEKATLTHAKGFTLEYFKHYKVVTVTAPWPDARESFRYVLVQCGAPAPEGFADAQVIQIPVRSIAILSTTHLPHLELLEALDRLVAVSSYENVYSPAARQLITAGKVAEVGRGPSVNLERILDLRPDLVTAVGHDQPQYNTHPLLRNAGVNVAINSEYVEPTLLGRSEWLKFTAAFLNRDGLAQRRFAAMAERYAALAAQVRDVPAAQKPSVFGGFLHRDVWYVPGGDSYIARLVADAGGRYLWADDTHQASIPLSFEAVFERAGDAEVWFISDLDWFKRADLLAANERYGAFKAFRDGRVYNQNARLNEHKANDYWELGIVEPDIVLADVIKILHPDRLPEHQLKYYRWLP